MIFPMKGSKLRGSGFGPESLQRALPELPPPSDAPGPLTPQEWEWLLSNVGLVRYAADTTLGRVTAQRVGYLTLLANAAPALAAARLGHDPTKGASLNTYRTDWMRSYFGRAVRAHLYPCPGKAGEKGYHRTPPLLLGSYTPEGPEVGRGERPGEPELAEAAMDAFAALDGRHRQALAMYLGLGGPGVKLRTIGRTLGVTKERARQLVDTAIVEIRRALGLREPLRRRYTRLAPSTPYNQLVCQRKYYAKRQAAKAAKETT